MTVLPLEFAQSAEAQRKRRSLARRNKRPPVFGCFGRAFYTRPKTHSRNLDIGDPLALALGLTLAAIEPPQINGIECWLGEW
jgi:hypothetical protein